MSARKVIIGCSAVALVTLAFLVIGGIVAFKRLTAPAPLPTVAQMADSESLGLAIARLEPDDPWVRGTMEHLRKYSTHEQKPKEIFPLELVWTERRAPADQEQHILSLSLSHGGRFAGLVCDLMLWKAGRAGHEKVSRVEYGGEGITSFPGTPLHGHLFVRDNSFIWTSDLDTAKKAVDLLAHAAAGPGGPESPAAAPKVYSILPPGGRHVLSGAILNENGSLARSLSLLPGEALDLPPETLATVESLTFTVDTSSASDGTGEIVLSFVPGTPAATMAGVAQEISAKLALLPLAKVTIEATPRIEEARAVLALKIGGLESVAAPLFEKLTRSVRQIESFSSEGRPGREFSWPGGTGQPEPAGPAADPNQSSSTFQ